MITLHWLSPLIHLAFMAVVVLFGICVYFVARAEHYTSMQPWLLRAIGLFFAGVFLFSLR